MKKKKRKTNAKKNKNTDRMEFLSFHHIKWVDALVDKLFDVRSININ